MIKYLTKIIDIIKLSQILIYLFLSLSLITLYSETTDDMVILDEIRDQPDNIEEEIKIIHEYYRSNYNGLELLKITHKEISEHKFYVDKVIDESKVKYKYLYENNREIKRWEYFYSGERRTLEKFFIQSIISESYQFDSKGYKKQLLEYKDGALIRQTRFTYNENGLVELEKILNILTGDNIEVSYKYDKDLRIKQIIKTFPDGKVVYWDSFLTNKGIITKEYYTVGDESYAFYYNENGQEVKGEVTKAGKTEPDIVWHITYSGDGIKHKKEEDNLIIGKSIRTWYNKKGTEAKIETLKNGSIEKIEEFDYNKDEKLVMQRLTIDLNVTENHYIYEKDSIIKMTEYENSKLKRVVMYNKDGDPISETIYNNDGNAVEIDLLEINKVSELN